LAAVVGCQGPTKPVPPTTTAPSSTTTPAPNANVAPPVKKKEPAQASVAHPPPTAKTTDGETPDVGAVGMDETKVKELFGTPLAEEDNAPERRLKYHTGSCSVEFALYPDVDTRTYRILTLEVSSDDGTAKGRRSCINQLKSRIAAQ
jgi:hypothetical protein